MQNFQIKSPGKVILHGEHAVVYHRPAIAAAIGLSTKLEFRRKPESQVAQFHLEVFNRSLQIRLHEFNDFLSTFRSKYSSITVSSTAKLLDEVRVQVANQLNDSATCPTSPQHTDKAFLSIYYLLAGATLSSPHPNLTMEGGFEIYIDSELNVGAGLGSSASFGAALAAAFLLYTRHFDVESYMLPENQELISMWAYQSERVMHGTPSGVDNTICTHGGMLRYDKGRGFRPVEMLRPLNILLVDSRVNRSTADVVANVRHLHETFPNVIDAIWNACEQVVEDAEPLYESYGNGQDDSEKFGKLERLFQINNDLMKAIGASHSKLEEIFAIAFRRGFFSKLTGAGAGGFAIVLLPVNYESNEVYWKLKEELEAAGFGLQVTTAGGVGLRIQQLHE